MTKTLSVLGVTGSVGASTLKVIAHSPDRYDVNALVAGSNVDALAKACVETGAKRAVIADPSKYDALKIALSGTSVEVSAGRAAVLEVASQKVDTLVSAMVGAAGLEPTVAGIKAGSNIALANKETMVCAGTIVRALSEEMGIKLLPMDSEHNAVFQVFEQENAKAVDKVIVTASGGPFRTSTLDEMRVATPEMALKHPNWSMGRRITIDSATMVNKGLELIEAFHLFPITPDQLDVVVHPQSIVHGMVRYCDGSLLAHMAVPDMCGPIAYCLDYPTRKSSPVAQLDLGMTGRLDFEKPDYDRFPALSLARRVMELGDGAGTVFNAADEIAVDAFLNRKIGFLQIVELLENVLDRLHTQNMLDCPHQLEEILLLDQEARRVANEFIGKMTA
ncbi:1-deoxy-D-xylulose-5-phosphate reductoisomerase [Pseudovibrio sp. Tun.PSC04-5.I4]|uniref:1-deoxy-D-xylulose-5-phosphate reductoisomerase n=1 Tax=Pseudovibrio sp. Tun.PSC04-5.I4 TaxID=1798213 RepID=UPI0008818B4E|nr:1-deoxy-D-xylulose-5-phosphate reductoisomerase [Pseudovibrio sp. Tun.PSC04-5.I4]SDR07167.1 1-deoxy-D-xylulose 5-phosphate reductoisomerase [Pseudovibrio sp. Tun.PSC04-5.I4]